MSTATSATAVHVLVVSVDPDDSDAVVGAIECPGVTDACRVWWECQSCNNAIDGVGNDKIDDVIENGAHGVEHTFGEYGLMAASDDCMAQALDAAPEGIAEAAEGLLPGQYPVDVDYYGEGGITVTLITSVDANGAQS